MSNDENNTLTEADMRIEVAQFYRLFINSPVFKKTTSEAANLVASELKVFAQKRLNELLGLAKEGAGGFTEEEVVVLKQLVQVAKRKSVTNTEAIEKPEPTVASKPATKAKVKQKETTKPEPTLQSVVAPGQVTSPDIHKMPLGAEMESVLATRATEAEMLAQRNPLISKLI